MRLDKSGTDLEKIYREPTNSKVKNVWMKVAAFYMIVATTMSFVSCSSDEEAVSDDSVVVLQHHECEVETVSITYTLNLDWTWFDYFDLSVVYTNGLGEEETVDLDFVSWRYQSNLPVETSAKKASFRLLATPKPNLPEFEDSQEYTGAYSFLMEIHGYRLDGSEEKSFGQIVSDYNSEIHNGLYLKRKLSNGGGVYTPISSSAWSREIESY
jgi:hypothetical protein